MCELDDLNGFAERRADVSRRQFGALAVGTGLSLTGLSMMLPALASAADLHDADVDIKTPDGTADAYFVHPAKGKFPAVLVWPDIFGLRPAFKEMARRLAAEGYAVLVVNPFYRVKRAPTAPEHADFQDPATRSALVALMSALTPETAVTDAKAFVTWLDTQSAVDKKKKMGVTGYCMGGPFTLRTAATLPNRVGAGASFHGGGLVTDKPNSPHLLVPQLKAQFLFAIAENDDQRQPEAKDVLRDAFAKANLHAEIEVYAGAQHGWCPPDSPVYNHDQAEKAWGRQLALFKTALV
jgi:carboxymethylenebutenolidase